MHPRYPGKGLVVNLHVRNGTQVVDVSVVMRARDTETLTDLVHSRRRFALHPIPASHAQQALPLRCLHDQAHHGAQGADQHAIIQQAKSLART